MKNLLRTCYNSIYVFLMISVVVFLFAIPKCSTAQSRYYNADDFRGSKMRGFNISYINSLAELAAKDLPGAKAAGANLVRIWIGINHDSYNNYFYCNYAATKLSTSPLPVIDSAVRLCEKLNLPIVFTVEIHPRQGKADYWGNATRQTNITKKWVEFATRYKDKKIIAAYDLMNEPRYNSTTGKGTTKDCVQFQADIINAVRKVDSSHTIFVEVLKNQMLGDLALRSDSVIFKQRLLPIKNLVYSPHGYSYLNVTHQGTGADFSTRYTYRDTSNYDYSKVFLTNSYWQEPMKFSKKYNVPLCFGEFSCINWAPKNKLGGWTSTQWVTDAILFMESIGASWAYHAWNEYQGWDARISSQWYIDNATFTAAKPSKMPSASARSNNAPTYKVLDSVMNKNQVLP